MKVSNTLIEEVIVVAAGADVVPLVRMLKNKKNVSEFKLAEDLKEEINRTRNMLYRLHDANLVTFTRKKDKKKGWYIYYWTLNNKMFIPLQKKIMREKAEKLQEKLGRLEGGNYYFCPNGCVRLDFEQALAFEFKCPECGEMQQPEDNSEEIKKLKTEIKEIEKLLKEKPRRREEERRVVVKKVRVVQRKPARKKPIKKTIKKNAKGKSKRR